MSDADRPGGRDPNAVPSLRIYRGRRARDARPTPAPPTTEIVERLTALERQVEAALGAEEAPPADPRLVRSADLVLAALATAGRGSLREAIVGRTERALAGLVPGASPAARVLVDALHRWWWRVESFGLERLPAERPVMLVANRGGGLLPWEALVVPTALAAWASVHPLLDERLARLPVLGSVLGELGAVRGAAAARALLADGGALVVFPEGSRAEDKTFRRRYRLAGFGRGTFARLAIEASATIVPLAVIGVEETQPVLARVGFPGFPALPVTPTFPWLGVAGLLPLPAKLTLHIGEPLDVAARHDPAEATDARAVGLLRDGVRERLQALVQDGLRRRNSIFRG
jgi:1-acyl-sn-glycerol-3-phosphate acyltransferase